MKRLFVILLALGAFSMVLSFERMVVLEEAYQED